MHLDAPRRRLSALFYAAAFSFFILTAGLLGAAAAGAATETSPQTPLVGVGA
jgi:hypothetical protein